MEFGLAHVRAAKLFPEPGQQNKGKFQAFALVDGHDADDILALRQDLYLTDVHLAAFVVDGVHVVDKSIQAAGVVRLVLLGFVRQRPQIGKTLGAGRHGGCKGGISAVRQQFPQKIPQGHVAGKHAPTVQLRGERQALILQRTIRPFGLIFCKDAVIRCAGLSSAFCPDADLRQFGSGKPEHRGAQHAQQRHVLAAVVDDAQQIEEHLDLHRVEIPFAAV